MGSPKCLITALQGDFNFTKALRASLCIYNGTVDENDENYQKTGKDLIKGLACAGCPPEKFLEPGETYEDLYENPEKLAAEISSIVVKIEKALGPTPALRNFTCDLDGRALETQCLIRISFFNKTLSSEAPRINKLVCENDINALTSEQTLGFLMDLRCYGGATRDALKELLNDRSEDVAKKALSKVAYDLLFHLYAKQIIKPCDPSQTTKGEDPAA